MSELTEKRLLDLEETKEKIHERVRNLEYSVLRIEQAGNNMVEMMKDLKENHYTHLQKSYESLEDRVNKEIVPFLTDVKWLKKFFWIVATAGVGSLIASILNLILK